MHRRAAAVFCAPTRADRPYHAAPSTDFEITLQITIMSEQTTQSILVKRVDSGVPDTNEIRALAQAAGHELIEELTQVRSEDSAYNLGQGAIERLGDRIEATEADAVVFDNELRPQQIHNIGELVPAGTRLIDRNRLILDIFEEQAGTRKAQLQVQLAELRYRLPRVQAEIRLEKAVANERRARGGLGEKENRRITDIKERIQRIEEKLDSMDAVGTDRRERYSDVGLSLVALAGYTNAGKSTLLRRLADDLTVNETSHADLPETAGAADRLFKTLDTTTRRATLDDRAILLTDTVGFISDLPEWLASIEPTLDLVRDAELVCLVIDASDPPDRIREKIETSRNQLPIDSDTARERVLPVLNKADLADEEQLTVARDAVSSLGTPAVISATEGTGIGELCARLREMLPERRARLDLPNSDATMSFVSWAYDNASVEFVSYDDGTVAIELAGHPTTIREATTRAEELNS